jgi:three-Cys-motif partner protein
MAESVVGPWAQDKLERLRKYLHAYTSIMKEQKWCEGYYYIDAFAGPGEHEVRKRKTTSRNEAQQTLLDVANYGAEQEEQRQFLAGSPRVALDLQFPFTHYIFVERSADRIAALDRLKTEYGSARSIHIREEECTEYLRDRIAVNPKMDWRTNRAIVFLDPFGMQVDWQTIEELAKTQAIEIFLNFPVGMAIQRLLLRQPDNFTDDRQRRLDEYFGSPDWKGVLYKRRPTLFDEGESTAEQEKIEKSGAALLKWYRGRLRTIFSHVSKAALIRNTKRGHLYYLLLASHNKTGVKIANEILSAGEAI